MRALVRWSAILGLMGGAIFGAPLAVSLPALALTEEQIEQKLALVPVYTIATQEGNQVQLLPLPYEQVPRQGQTPPPQAQPQVIPGFRFFINRGDAQSFLDELKKKTDVPQSAQVIPLPLSEAYERARENNKQPEKERLVIELEPSKQQVEAATTLLRQSGQQVNQFAGVPLFIVRFGPDKGYVPIKVPQSEQEIVPLFFSKEDALNLLNQVKPKQPAADIQVLNIDSVIDVMRTKNDTWLNQVYLIPTPESRELLRTITTNQQQGGNRPAGGQQTRPNSQQNRPNPPAQSQPAPSNNRR